ncbi:MAG: hypothetical protein BWY83_00169 [bacterium ADurb.Bin478]|nr:MAG: hypothetical protein BWY83_00169 [bacterium ADurb.Bin478]
MDTSIYEFWVRFFSSLAQGRNPWEGLLPGRAPEPSGADAFAEFFRFLALFDVVPRADYQRLEDECAALKEKVASQERTLAALKRRRGRKAAAFPEETVERLQEVIRRQNEEFQSLMKAAADLFPGDTPAS